MSAKKRFNLAAPNIEEEHHNDRDQNRNKETALRILLASDRTAIADSASRAIVVTPSKLCLQK